MSNDLVAKMQKAGVSCLALRSWCRCHDGKADLCETCILDGPEGCDAQVIEALVDRVVNATGHTDEALGQRDYWKRTADRLCDVVFDRDREKEDEG